MCQEDAPILFAPVGRGNPDAPHQYAIVWERQDPSPQLLFRSRFPIYSRNSSASGNSPLHGICSHRHTLFARNLSQHTICFPVTPFHFDSSRHYMCKMSHKISKNLYFKSILYTLYLSIRILRHFTTLIYRGIIMDEYGTIRIKLDELIQKSGISKNKLSHRAEMQRTQINNYCNNDITRLDIDVLARICTVFNCEIGDLLEFVPPEK